MDKIHLIISVVLIVSGAHATLGSPIEQDHPEADPNPLNVDGEEQTGTSTLILRDEEDEKAKRKVSAGTVISGAELTINVLQKVLDAIAGVDRKVAIGVENKSVYQWKAVGTYFYSGTSDVPLPSFVNSGSALVYNARKTTGPVATGAVGVLTYYISGLKKTLAVMFSVPYDYNLYSNWWNVKLYNGQDGASKAMYKEMYNSNPFKGDNSWSERNIGSGLKIRGSMASSGQATLLIHVTST